MVAWISCQAQRLKGFKDENTGLARRLADAMLDNTALKGLLGKNGGARYAAASGRASRAASQDEKRRACRVIGCCRATMRYEAVRQDEPGFASG